MVYTSPLHYGGWENEYQELLVSEELIASGVVRPLKLRWSQLVFVLAFMNLRFSANTDIDYCSISNGLAYLMTVTT